MQNTNCDAILEKMKSKNITDEQIKLLKYCGVDFKEWLSGFSGVKESVKSTTEYIINHPLMPKDLKKYMA